jgi:drug/metabolite transporter (DMT)-like permease
MHSSLLEVVLFTLIVVSGTGGELCVSRAMKKIGEVHDFRPRAIVRVILRALRIGWMWAGVSMMALAFFSLLGALSFLNVSFVVPVTALSYVAGALGAMFFLRERVSSRRWIGVFLVSLGVTLVFLGRK